MPLELAEDDILDRRDPDGFTAHIVLHAATHSPPVQGIPARHVAVGLERSLEVDQVEVTAPVIMYRRFRLWSGATNRRMRSGGCTEEDVPDPGFDLLAGPLRVLDADAGRLQLPGLAPKGVHDGQLLRRRHAAEYVGFDRVGRGHARI